MKKIRPILMILLLVAFMAGNSQPVIFHEAPLFDNSTSTGRGPNGTSNHVYMRACALVKATELTNIASNSTLSTFGFTMNAGASVNAPTGNFTVYLQNTGDITYNKGTSFSTAIVGMTTVYASTMTIPVSATTTSVTVTLSTPFVYTGGGIYVAYDWYNPGPYSGSAVIYRCNSGGLSPGCATNASATGPAPDPLGTTAFRPCFLFGVINTYTNEIVITGMEAPGRLSGMLGTAHTVTAYVRNGSNQAKNNIVVSLNSAGANTFANTQTITSLASGAATTVTFSTFTPTLSGLNTLTVSVPADQNNANNSAVYNQSITCNEWALNPAGMSYTMGSVGFNTGSGVIAVTYLSPAASTLTGLRGAVSTNAPSAGNQSWGVLLSSTGTIIATTNTLTITNADLGTFMTYSFSPTPTLAANTTYYLGFAQPANAVGYFPMGTYTAAYVPYAKYVTTGTVGGTPAPLTANLGFFGIEAVFAPTLALTANSATVICGSTAVLSASTNASYTWASGPANTNYSVTPIVNTTYTLNGINSYGCSGSTTVTVAVNPLTVTAASSSGSICSGNTVAISATGAPSFTWNTGPSLNAASFTDNPMVTTIYSVQGSNSAGCNSTGTVMITVNASPTVAATSQTIICGNSAMLQATVTALGNASYTWVTGPSNSDFPVTPTVNTTYSVIAVDQAGCPAFATVAVAVNPITVTAASSASTICSGSTVNIAGGGAANYIWSAGSSTLATVFTDTPSTTTTYSVLGLNGACTGTAFVTLIVNSFTTMGLSNASLTTCSGGTVSATATGAASYTWNTGSSTFSTAAMTEMPASSGLYTVSGTDQNGCSASMTLTITVNANPTVTALAITNTVMCTGESNTLTANGAVNYSWSEGSSGASIIVTPSVASIQVYTVTGTSAESCAGTAVVALQVNDCTGFAEAGSGLSSVSVYPNPFQDVIHVRLENDTKHTEIKVLNTLGELVLYLKHPENLSKLDLVNKANGVYFIQVIQNGTLVDTIRIIKD